MLRRRSFGVQPAILGIDKLFVCGAKPTGTVNDLNTLTVFCPRNFVFPPRIVAVVVCPALEVALESGVVREQPSEFHHIDSFDPMRQWMATMHPTSQEELRTTVVYYQ